MIKNKYIKTSISDNQEYPAFCDLAAKNDNIFKNFKRNLIYNTVLEHVTYKQGKRYLKIIISQTPELINLFDKFRENDKYGNPYIYNYGTYGKFSPTTLRYIKVLSDLKIVFKDLKNMKIIEIGSGYSGQAKIISDCFNIASYINVDLKPVLSLSKKYLDKLWVENVNFLTLDELKKDETYDLMISNYAFSECIRPVQDLYFEKVIMNSQRGYITWNFLTHDVDIDSYTIKEFTKKIKNPRIIVSNPHSFSVSRILLWDNTKKSFPISLLLYFSFYQRTKNFLINFPLSIYYKIKRYFKKIIRHLLNKVSGRVMFQSFWERLYEISYIGMNFGGVDIQIGGEKEILKRLSQSINDDVIPVIFDVGANVGEYSLEVISVFGNKMKLYCFEPSKEEAFPLLVQNLKGYENVKLYNFGLGDKNETATLYSCRENSLLSSKEKSSTLSSVFLRRMDHLGTQMRYKEKIELKRLDDFCKNNAINHIHLLKLDAEGNELNILKGAKQLIDSNSIDLIQFEFGGCNIDSKTFFQDFFYLLNPNYRIYRILKDGLRPIDKYNEKQEVFHATNYLAVYRKL